MVADASQRGLGEFIYSTAFGPLISHMSIYRKQLRRQNRRINEKVYNLWTFFAFLNNLYGFEV